MKAKHILLDALYTLIFMAGCGVGVLLIIYIWFPSVFKILVQ